MDPQTALKTPKKPLGNPRLDGVKNCFLAALAESVCAEEKNHRGTEGTEAARTASVNSVPLWFNRFYKNVVLLELFTAKFFSSDDGQRQVGQQTRFSVLAWPVAANEQVPLFQASGELLDTLHQSFVIAGFHFHAWGQHRPGGALDDHAWRL